MIFGNDTYIIHNYYNTLMVEISIFIEGLYYTWDRHPLSSAHLNIPYRGKIYRKLNFASCLHFLLMEKKIHERTTRQKCKSYENKFLLVCFDYLGSSIKSIILVNT